MKLSECAIGSRVVVKNSNGPADVPNGETGVIVGPHVTTVLVDFDHWRGGHNGSRNNRISNHQDKRAFWMTPDQIELI